MYSVNDDDEPLLGALACSVIGFVLLVLIVEKLSVPAAWFMPFWLSSIAVMSSIVAVTQALLLHVRGSQRWMWIGLQLLTVGGGLAVAWLLFPLLHPFALHWSVRGEYWSLPIASIIVGVGCGAMLGIGQSRIGQFLGQRTRIWTFLTTSVYTLFWMFGSLHNTIV